VPPHHFPLPLVTARASDLALMIEHAHVISASTVLYCTVLYCIVLYCIVLYCIVLYSLMAAKIVQVHSEP